MSITIYKTRTCAVCTTLAKFLTQKKQKFNEIYIDDDLKLQQYVYERSGGFYQVPFTVIEKDGLEHHVSGGNLARISELVLQ